MSSSNSSPITSYNRVMGSKNPRTCIFRVGSTAGRLCSLMAEKDDRDATTAVPSVSPVSSSSSSSFSDSSSFPTTHTTAADNTLIVTIADLLYELYWTCTTLNLNLIHAIHSKLELNRRKYPVELCKGKAGKYTEYSHVTGVTTDNQSTVNQSSSSSSSVLSWTEICDVLPTLIMTIQDFATERQWTKFHTPRNLVLALLGEVGELAEIVQWKGDDGYDVLDEKKTVEGGDLRVERLGFSVVELDQLAQELADVSIYLLRLVSVIDVTDRLMKHLHPSETTTTTTTSSSSINIVDQQ